MGFQELYESASDTSLGAPMFLENWILGSSGQLLTLQWITGKQYPLRRVHTQLPGDAGGQSNRLDSNKGGA